MVRISLLSILGSIITWFLGTELWNSLKNIEYCFLFFACYFQMLSFYGFVIQNNPDYCLVPRSVDRESYFSDPVKVRKEKSKQRILFGLAVVCLALGVFFLKIE